MQDTRERILRAAEELFATRGFDSTSIRRKPESPVLSIEAIKLKKTRFARLVRSRGSVQAWTDSTLIPEVSGKIIQVSTKFQDGEFFEKDELLLRIDPRNYQVAGIEAQTEVARAELERAKIKIDHQNYRTTIAVAKSTLAQEETRYQDVSRN